MHKDSTIHIIKCMLRYSQHNFLKHSVNSYGKITLAKILGHFWLVIICWEHYRCHQNISHKPPFITAARWSRRIKSNISRRRRTSQRQSWERCCCWHDPEVSICLLLSREIPTLYIERHTEQKDELTSPLLELEFQEDFCINLIWVLGFRFVYQPFCIQQNFSSLLVLGSSWEIKATYSQKQRI